MPEFFPQPYRGRTKQRGRRVVVAAVIPRSLFDQVDALARRADITRSAWLHRAIRLAVGQAMVAEQHDEPAVAR